MKLEGIALKNRKSYKFLYHGSPSSNLQELRPQSLSKQNINDTSRVYATPELAFAAIFTMPAEYKYLQGFSGRTEKGIYVILPQPLDLNNDNIEKINRVISKKSQLKGYDIIQALQSFYEILEKEPVSIYTLNPNDFKPAKLNSDLEFYSENNTKTIPHLTQVFPSAMSAMSKYGVMLYQIDLPIFLEMKESAFDTQKQAEYRKNIFGNIKPSNLSKYRFQKSEFQIFE